MNTSASVYVLLELCTRTRLNVGGSNVRFAFCNSKLFHIRYHTRALFRRRAVLNRSRRAREFTRYMCPRSIDVSTDGKTRWLLRNHTISKRNVVLETSPRAHRVPSFTNAHCLHIIWSYRSDFLLSSVNCQEGAFSISIVQHISTSPYFKIQHAWIPILLYIYTSRMIILWFESFYNQKSIKPQQTRDGGSKNI